MHVLHSIKNEIIKIMDNDPAHDFEHVMRVYNNAQKKTRLPGSLRGFDLCGNRV